MSSTVSATTIDVANLLDILSQYLILAIPATGTHAKRLCTSSYAPTSISDIIIVNLGHNRNRWAGELRACDIVGQQARAAKHKPGENIGTGESDTRQSLSSVHKETWRPPRRLLHRFHQLKQSAPSRRGSKPMAYTLLLPPHHHQCQREGSRIVANRQIRQRAMELDT
jgi:hypothetical protein